MRQRVKASLCQEKLIRGDILRVLNDQAGISMAQNPVAEPCNTGINPRLVDLGAANTPAHHSSQEEPSWSTFTHQRASRIALRVKIDITCAAATKVMSGPLVILFMDENSPARPQLVQK